MTAYRTDTIGDLVVVIIAWVLTGIALKTKGRTRSIIEQPPWRILSFLMLIIGTATLVVGLVFYYRAQPPSGYKNTVGTVSKITPVQRWSYSNHCLTRYAPCNVGTPYYTYDATVSFNANAHPYSFKENLGGTPLSYQVGQKVNVAYEPSNPGQNPKDTSNKLNQYVPQIASIVGFIFALVGSTVMFLGRNK